MKRKVQTCGAITAIVSASRGTVSYTEDIKHRRLTHYLLAEAVSESQP